MKYPIILLLGATGQLGFELKKKLKNFGNAICPKREDLDIENFNSIRKTIRNLKPSLIINCAAYTNVNKAETDYKIALKINTKAPEILAKESLKLNIPLIHFSTDYVFDGKSKFAYKENDQTDPLNNYGKTKLKGEIAIKKNCKKFIIIRTSWVYNSKRGKNFYRTMIKLFKKKNEIRVINDQRGCPTSVQFLAKKIQKILTQLKLEKEKRWGVYHLTENKIMTWYEFAIRILKLENLKFKKIKILPVSSSDYTTLIKRPKNSVLDLTKIKSNFNL